MFDVVVIFSDGESQEFEKVLDVTYLTESSAAIARVVFDASRHEDGSYYEFKSFVDINMNTVQTLRCAPSNPQ